MSVCKAETMDLLRCQVQKSLTSKQSYVKEMCKLLTQICALMLLKCHLLVSLTLAKALQSLHRKLLPWEASSVQTNRVELEAHSTISIQGQLLKLGSSKLACRNPTKMKICGQQTRHWAKWTVKSFSQLWEHLGLQCRSAISKCTRICELTLKILRIQSWVTLQSL